MDKETESGVGGMKIIKWIVRGLTRLGLKMGNGFTPRTLEMGSMK